MSISKELEDKIIEKEKLSKKERLRLIMAYKISEKTLLDMLKEGKVHRCQMGSNYKGKFLFIDFTWNGYTIEVYGLGKDREMNERLVDTWGILEICKRDGEIPLEQVISTIEKRKRRISRGRKSSGLKPEDYIKKEVLNEKIIDIIGDDDNKEIT